MLAVALLFVGITLVSNGVLFLLKSDIKSIAVLNLITAFVLITGNVIGLANATTMMDYCNAGGGFLFGFTYLLIGFNLLFNLDTRVYGMYSGMVAIFAIVMGIWGLVTATGLVSYLYVYLWFAWAILWGAGFIENVFKKNFGKFTCILCILEGVFAAFVPALMMFMGILF